jgi:L-amino acid N-acyltransferase YncA
MSRCRLARLSDAPQIQAIYAPIVRDTPISFEYEPPDVAEIERRMSKVLASRPWLVREEAGVVQGYAYASTFRERQAYDWGVEVSIYVHPTAHGRGMGRSLYATLFDVLRPTRRARSCMKAWVSSWRGISPRSATSSAGGTTRSSGI